MKWNVASKSGNVWKILHHLPVAIWGMPIFYYGGKEGGKHDDFNSSFDGERNEKSFLGEGGKMHLFFIALKHSSHNLTMITRNFARTQVNQFTFLRSNNKNYRVCVRFKPKITK